MAASRIAASLKSARERLGWSRETLAHQSGLSWSAITQIESGRRQEVRASSLVALASALGVSVDYLVGGEAATSPGLLNHRVLAYGSDDEYLATTVPFLREGVAGDDCVLAVTSKVHIDLLHDALGADATHVEFMDAANWYSSLRSAASGYREIVKDRFERGAPWIRIMGEPVWAGWGQAEIIEWFRYEAMINLSFASSPATIVCTYDTRSLPVSVIEDAYRSHPQVAGVGDVAASPTYREPADFLLTLG